MKLPEDKALYRMAAYCSKAERCEYDVRNKLQNYELEENSIDTIIIRLKKEKFLDDIRFCESFIKDKVRFNKWGKIKIAFELRKKRIPQEIIDKSMEGIHVENFEEALRKILQTKEKTVKATNEYDKKMKLTRFALGRGYDLDIIKLCLSDILKNDNDDYFP